MFKATTIGVAVAAVVITATVGPSLVEKVGETRASVQGIGSVFAAGEAHLGAGGFAALADDFEACVAAGIPVEKAGLSPAELAEAHERGLTVKIECREGSDFDITNKILAEAKTAHATEIGCFA